MHQLDLQLLNTYSISTFGLADMSVYTPGLVITNPTIEITAGSFPKVSLDFTPQTVNVFNASNLSVNCTNTTPLPDGIYTVKYSVNPNATTWVEKSWMRTDSLMCSYMRTFLAIDLKCQCDIQYQAELKTRLFDIRLLIEGSISAANNCDTVGAYAMYNKASTLLDRLSKCQCNCIK